MSGNCGIRCPTRLKKWPLVPSSPNNFGNWVDMIDSAAPALNPTRILSLIKLTIELNFNAQATKQIIATTNAANPAMSIHFCWSPPESIATVDPTIKEIEEVGPTAICFDEVNNAKNKPPISVQ